jgi:hypothetical protein
LKSEMVQAMEEMDGAKFSKLCRDCKLLNRSFTTIDVDLIFAKTKVKVGLSTPHCCICIVARLSSDYNASMLPSHGIVKARPFKELCQSR